MDMGVGFFEILFILLLILVFFGSKELPKFVRESARMVAKLRKYSDRIRRELNEISSVPDGVYSSPTDDTNQTKKKELRHKLLEMRRNLTPAERAEKSGRIRKLLEDSKQFRDARAIMIYVSMGSEVETKEMINEMLSKGKRVLVPYSRREFRSLGMGEITDLAKDIISGEGRAPEPRPELRDRFFRSDLQLILCPGVGFDIYGGRLGRGFAYYDNFLRELKSKVPIFGLAFDCQMRNEHLPFSYSDVTMDQIVTESGFKLPDRTDGGTPSVPEGFAG
ncbi:MAG: 5-formyltetrahydrofolate cyclo-ligase [Chitinispirillaceae bacterium]